MYRAADVWIENYSCIARFPCDSTAFLFLDGVLITANSEFLIHRKPTMAYYAQFVRFVIFISQVAAQNSLEETKKSYPS